MHRRDHDQLDALLAESGLGHDPELRALLTRLQDEAVAGDPLPSPAVARLMSFRPSRRRRHVVVALVAGATVLAGGAAAAAAPQSPFGDLAGGLLGGLRPAATSAPTPHEDSWSATQPADPTTPGRGADDHPTPPTEPPGPPTPPRPDPSPSAHPSAPPRPEHPTPPPHPEPRSTPNSPHG
jgi:outer membrane biosynthesis protein TonB